MLERSDTSDINREILGGNAGPLSDNTVFDKLTGNLQRKNFVQMRPEYLALLTKNEKKET